MKNCNQDSVFSWIVAVSCLWIYTVIYGLVRLSGVLLVASMPRYGVGREAASLPYTLVNFTKNISGPLVGLLAKRFGIRPIIIFGILLAASGVGSCFVAENIYTVALLWGVVFGAGCAACIVLLPVLINHYFDKYRSIASGLSKSGVPLGSFIMPLIADAFLDQYEISGTFLILSGFVLNCLPAALLLKCPNFVAKNIKFTVEKPFYDEEKQRLISKEKSVLYTNENYKGILSSNKMPSTLTSEISSQNPYNNTLASPELNGTTCPLETPNNQRKKSWPTSNPTGNDILNSTNHEKFSSSLDACRNSYKTLNISCNDIASGGKAVGTEIGVSIKRGNQNQSNKTEKEPSLILDFSKGNQVIQTNKSDNFRKEKNKGIINKKDNSVSKINVQKTSSKSISLLCDPLFLIVVFIAPCTVFTSTCMFSTIVDFSTDIGIAAEYGKYTVIVVSGGEIFGHLVIGLMTNGLWVRNTIFLTICFLAQAIAVIAVAWSTEFYMLMCTLAVFGCTTAGYSVLTPLVLGDFIETENQMLAITSSVLLGGPASLAVTPMIGYFRDGIGSYEYLFYVNSVLSLLCSFLWLGAHFITNRRQKYLRR